MVAFIDQYWDAYGVEPICTQLPIAPATYYEHRARALNAARITPEVLRTLVLDNSSRCRRVAGDVAVTGRRSPAPHLPDRDGDWWFGFGTY